MALLFTLKASGWETTPTYDMEEKCVLASSDLTRELNSASFKNTTLSTATESIATLKKLFSYVFYSFIK